MKVKFTNSNKCFEIIKRYVGIIALTISLMLFNATLNAQSLGLNQPTPDASSILDAVATDRGVLIPRVALTATNAVGPIAAPADALLVYNTATAGGAGVNVTPGFYYYNTATTAWIRLFSGGGSPGVRWDQIVDPGAGLTLSHGTNATIFNFANVATTGFAMNATALTAGKLLSLTSSNAAATGNVLHVTTNSTGALAAGGILFDFTANHTGVGFEVDDVTTAGSVMKMNANSLVGGIGLDIVSTATGLTGRLQSIQLTGDNAGNTNASNLLYIGSSGASSVSKGLTVDLASTGALAAGGVLFNFANHTGFGVNLVDVTTAGTAMSILTNALAGGTGLSIASSSTGNNMTGNLASITLSGNNVGNTGDLLELNSSGATSIAKALNVQVASAGNFSTTGAVAFNFSAAHTGSAFRIDDATTAGTAVDLVANAIAAGTGLDISSSATGNIMTGNLARITLSGNNVGNTGDLLELNSSGATSIAKALNVQVASTGNFSTTGAVAFNFSGAHTGSGFRIDDATQTGKVLDIVGSGVTTGRLLDVATSGNTWTGNGTTNGLAIISSSSTAGTGGSSSILLQLTRTGANANNPHTAYGIYSTVANTNVTASTNVAGFFSATGATTANYAIEVPTSGGTVKMGDGTLLDMSAITGVNSQIEGLKLPQATDNQLGIAEGQMTWDSDNDLLQVGTGTVVKTIGIPNGMAMFNTPGVTVWAVPDNVTTVWVKIWGNGGGGGSGDGNESGGGGGGGGYTEAIADVTGMANCNVTIGILGAGGGASSDGTAGGDNIFECVGADITAKGGAQGLETQTAGAGGIAGSGAGAFITLAGQSGRAGVNSAFGLGGAGGAAAMGGAGGQTEAPDEDRAAETNTTGAAGCAPGGGGAGGSSDTGNGGNGALGMVIIYW